MSLDMNYQPKALVDTATLTEDEWLAWRKKGIGGSDVAAALNLSPYRTARELYYDKIGVEPVIAPADKSITFAIGASAGRYRSAGVFQANWAHGISGSDHVSASTVPIHAR